MATIVRDLGLGGILLQLVEGTCTESIGTHQTCLESSSLVPSGQLGTCCRLTSTLQTNKHDDIGLALARLEGFGMRVDELDEFIENGLLDEAFLVDARREVLEVDGTLDRLAQVDDEFDVDIGFDEGVGDFLDHGLERLHELATVAAGKSDEAHLLVEVGRPREVGNSGIDAPP